MTLLKSQTGVKVASWLLSSLLLMPSLVACGGNKSSVDDSRTVAAPNAAPGTAPQQNKKQGLSTAQKAGITLAGAAALYYIYNQHKKSQAQKGQQPQYYLSKNGRVYYRDAQKQVHYVTPPKGGIQVPADEAQQYEQFQGYNGRSTGRDLTSLPEARSATF